MPLIILTGYPCSGLTHRANQIATGLRETQETLFADSDSPRYKINIVSTHDASHPRTVYDNARTEKEARGVAYTRARRALGKNSFVILDGMNYIKGYRYQLWCEAKALGTTCCVVHVGTPIDQCEKNNEARIRRRESQSQAQSRPEPQNDSNPAPKTPDIETDTTDPEPPYPPTLLTNLIFRYEEPSTHSRWDKPLFTVPWTDTSPPIPEIWTALTGLPHPSTATTNITTDPSPISALTSTLSTTALISSTPSIATTQTASNPRPSTLGRPRIKPHLATVQPTSTDSSLLYSMEKRTSAVVSGIRNYVLENPSAEAALARSDEGGIKIEVEGVETAVFIPGHVATRGGTDELGGAGGILAVPKLQRLRRQWISLNRAYVAGNKVSLGKEQVGDAFVRFLNAELGGENE